MAWTATANWRSKALCTPITFPNPPFLSVQLSWDVGQASRAISASHTVSDSYCGDFPKSALPEHTRPAPNTVNSNSRAWIRLLVLGGGGGAKHREKEEAKRGS